ncbi:MAG: glycosyltransferase family 39 protein [Alphaproteobacteria bacterium]
MTSPNPIAAGLEPQNPWRSPLVFAGLLVATLLMRGPFYNIVHEDEAFYAVIAQRWLGGQWPYAASFDVKPPLTFAILAAGQALFGMHFWVIKVIEGLAVGLGAFGIWRLLEGYNQPRAALWAGLLFVGFSLPLLGVSSPAQLIQSAFTVWAFAQGVSARRRGRSGQAGVSGVLMGMAILTKQTAVFDATALAIFLLWPEQSGLSWRGFKLLVVWGLGALLPVLICSLAFVASGHGELFLRDTVVFALARAGLASQALQPIGPFGLGTRLLGFFGSLAPLMALVGALVLFVTRRSRLSRLVDPSLIGLLTLWLACASLGILAFLSIQPWYAFPLIPPLVMVAALVIEHALAFQAQGRLSLQILTVAFCVATGVFVDRDQVSIRSFSGAPDIEAARLASAALRDAGIRPSDRLLIPIRGQSVYVLTGNLPNAAYFNSSHLICAFAAPDRDPLAEALNSRPEFLLLSDTRFAYGCTVPGQVARIADHLRQNYRLVGSVHGTWDTLRLYRLVP